MMLLLIGGLVDLSEDTHHMMFIYSLSFFFKPFIRRREEESIRLSGW